MNRKTSLAVLMLSCLLALVCVATPVWSSDNLKPTTLTWVAGGVGGGWYVQAGGIASMITKKEPKLTIKVVPGGGVVNPVRVSRGKDDLGWGITFVDKMAVKGLAPVYKRANPDVRGLGGVFGVYHVHPVAAADKGLTTFQELADMVKAGKSINVAAPMKGTSDLPLFEAILDYYGISLKAIKDAGGKVIHAVYADMVNLYKDRHVDYVFTHLALPGAAITEMSISRDTSILSVSDDCVDFMNDSLGTLSRQSGLATIPAGTYKGVDKDVTAVVSAGELLINKDVPEEVAYTIIKLISENIEDLQKENPANKHFVPEQGWANGAVELHPGAVRFYKEAGYMK